jgi:drug/metabolite transporter superfamily protein YnfA
MDTVLSVVVLAALALVAGAIYLWRRVGARKQAGLMLVLALVMVVNVLIWTVPDDQGYAPIERLDEAAAGAP